MSETTNLERKLVILVILVIVSSASARRPTRIVGGTQAEDGEFPFIASIQKTNDKHICGGTIISKRHIVTAAHCVTGFPSVKNLTVLVHTNNVDGSGGIKFAVKAIRGHPDFLYNSTSQIVKNDIAIIILKKRIKFDTFASPVKMPKSPALPGTTCFLAGWGKLSYPFGADPNKLQKAGMTTISNSKCMTDLQWNILENQICTSGRIGVGACLYDSGGPLICDGVFTAIFIYMIPCGYGYPDLFTRVYSYMDFINSVTAPKKNDISVQMISNN